MKQEGARRAPSCSTDSHSLLPSRASSQNATALRFAAMQPPSHDLRCRRVERYLSNAKPIRGYSGSGSRNQLDIARTQGCPGHSQHSSRDIRRRPLLGQRECNSISGHVDVTSTGYVAAELRVIYANGAETLYCPRVDLEVRDSGTNGRTRRPPCR